MTHKRTFAEFTDRELRLFIDGCHASRDYSFWFEAACREWRKRVDAR